MNEELTIFDDIKQTDSNSEYFWSAWDLQKILGYTNWRSFEDVVKKAQKSFKTSDITSNYDIKYHFGQVVKMIETGKGAQRKVRDYRLSKYACYLIAQNGDPQKKPIALAQSYFNIQTFRQEQFQAMSEDEKRLFARQQVTDWDKKLFQSAKDSSVENYGKFYDAGYLGLYGMRSKEIRKKKGLGKDKVLDRAGTTELAANLFRITQTDGKLQNEIQSGKKIGDEAAANTHYDVGKIVRKTIEEIGGTMPEDLPPESEHSRKLEKRLKKLNLVENDQIKNSKQLQKGGHNEA